MKSLVILSFLLLPAVAIAQHDHSKHEKKKEKDHAEHASHSEHGGMRGMYGPYPMSRESSGTAWQPDATPMGGIHVMRGDWMFMFHGFATAVYTHQDGPRGDNDFYAPTMFMGMASRPLGAGTLGIRGMLSLDPATIGKRGYTELLQTGETADGVTPIIDRQHPHDFFMEMALSYSLPINDENTVFAYFGLPGEPALGPPTFMHRFSGVDFPDAPILHHWLDSTHITFGVATLGYIWKQFKLDASIFTGREPDENRWDIEKPGMDSYSVRLSWNPTEKWAAQVSYGNIHSPEILDPGVEVQRITASVIYSHDWEETHWQTMLAWGRNINDPGRILDGVMLESALRWKDQHTFLLRGESVQKDELFPPGHPNDGQRYLVHKLSLGYIYDFPEWHKLRPGLGVTGSAHFMPRSLNAFYGTTPLGISLFARVKF